MTQPVEIHPATVPADHTAGFLSRDLSIPGLERHTIADFWRWAYSDLLSNGNRSILAEYFVGMALGVADKPREEWNPVDLLYGNVAIEVKSSGYCQSWPQKPVSAGGGVQGEMLSPIRFSIRKATLWNRKTGEYTGEKTRSAEVYVFCIHAE